MPIVLEIPEATPSINAQSHAHWITAFRLRKRWRRLLRDAVYEAEAFPLPEIPPAFATVRVERFGKKLLDPDNLASSLKAVLDGLKDLRLIADDSPEHIHLEVSGYITKLPPHTRITIQPRMP